MAEPRDDQDVMSETGAQREDETSDTEHDRVRSSNDRDQQLERDGIVSKHNRGYDDAVQGERRGDVDPDSAAADVDRDDTVE